MQHERTGKKVFESSEGRLAHGINEFAKIVGVGKSTVYSEIRAGRLIAVKVGSRSLITSENGRAWLAGLPAIREVA